MNETAGIGELTGPISDIICEMNSFSSARNSTNDASTEWILCKIEKCLSANQFTIADNPLFLSILSE